LNKVKADIKPKARGGRQKKSVAELSAQTVFEDPTAAPDIPDPTEDEEQRDDKTPPRPKRPATSEPSAHGDLDSESEQNSKRRKLSSKSENAIVVEDSEASVDNTAAFDSDPSSD